MTKLRLWGNLTLLLVTLLVTQSAFGGAKFQSFTANDDQLTGEFLSPGTLKFVDGRLLMRGAVFETAVTPITGPSLSGSMLVTLNGNSDSTRTGPVWGTFVLTLDGGNGTFEGTWTGWSEGLLGNLQVEGFCTGPCVFGGVVTRHMKATEAITSFTELGVPYHGVVTGYLY